jgi:hypothetical protein
MKLVYVVPFATEVVLFGKLGGNEVKMKLKSL